MIPIVGGAQKKPGQDGGEADSRPVALPTVQQLLLNLTNYIIFLIKKQGDVPKCHLFRRLCRKQREKRPIIPARSSQNVPRSGTHHFLSTGRGLTAYPVIFTHPSVCLCCSTILSAFASVIPTEIPDSRDSGTASHGTGRSMREQARRNPFSRPLLSSPRAAAAAQTG